MIHMQHNNAPGETSALTVISPTRNRRITALLIYQSWKLQTTVICQTVSPVCIVRALFINVFRDPFISKARLVVVVRAL